MKAYVLCTTVLSIFLTLPAFGGDRAVARVGSEAITQRELTLASEQNPELSREKVLDLLMERRLVLLWAQKRNIKVSDEEVLKAETSIRERNNMSEDVFKQTLLSSGETPESFRAGLREQITINKALGMALSSRTQVTDAELQELYLKTYPRKTVYEVSHILLNVDKGATDEEDASVKKKAADILAEIKDGASFEAMARQYSQDTSSADRGGLLGTFNEGELLPELDQLASTLNPGESGGPVRTSAGYHILKLLSREFTQPPPLAEVKSSLERTLMAEKEQSVRASWLEELKKDTYIEVFPDDG